jgi:hypothetical protein
LISDPYVHRSIARREAIACGSLCVPAAIHRPRDYGVDLSEQSVTWIPGS